MDMLKFFCENLHIAVNAGIHAVNADVHTVDAGVHTVHDIQDNADNDCRFQPPAQRFLDFDHILQNNLHIRESQYRSQFKRHNRMTP